MLAIYKIHMSAVLRLEQIYFYIQKCLKRHNSTTNI